MAIFSNQATLTYNGNTTNSNIAYGEILEVLVATKTAIGGDYGALCPVTYVVTLRNTGGNVLSSLTITDDLGGYTFAVDPVYPLDYVEGSVALFVNGVVQAVPTVTAGPPLAVSGISIPAGGDAVLVYQARPTAFADPAAGGTITNTATVTGDGLSAPISAQATLNREESPNLTITKSITPSQVVDNDRVTYTFVIQNTGNQAVVTTDNAVITDVFDPILTALTVTFNGTQWMEGTQYTYDNATGLFTTNEGSITVPAATFTQDPTTGAYTMTPGIATLIVTGTI